MTITKECTLEQFATEAMEKPITLKELRQQIRDLAKRNNWYHATVEIERRSAVLITYYPSLGAELVHRRITMPDVFKDRLPESNW